MYPAIAEILRYIAHAEDTFSWNKETAIDADNLLPVIGKFSLVEILVIVFKILSYIRGLTVLLQNRWLDIIRGMELVQDVQKDLNKVREEVDDWSKICFEMVAPVVQEVGTEKPNIP